MKNLKQTDTIKSNNRRDRKNEYYWKIRNRKNKRSNKKIAKRIRNKKKK